MELLSSTVWVRPCVIVQLRHVEEGLCVYTHFSFLPFGKFSVTNAIRSGPENVGMWKNPKTGIESRAAGFYFLPSHTQTPRHADIPPWNSLFS